MNSRVCRSLALAVAFASAAATAEPLPTGRPFAEVNRYAQQRSVKIYGAGGFRQLEAYQSGFLVSGDGHVATAASVVLDRDVATVVLHNGLRLNAELVGVDPLLEVAVLKLDTVESDLPHFDLAARVPVREAMRVLAYSNLYNIATGNEPVSVLRGTVSSVAPLEARRGAFRTRYQGEVYIVDAAVNNPGAAGGVLVDLNGRPLGMLGKEVRSRVTGAWLHYALPWEQVAASVQRVLAGEVRLAERGEADLPEQPVTFTELGFHLVPGVVARTPPYVDQVQPDSPAAAAGLQPDDLLVAVAGMRTGSRAEVEQALRRIPTGTRVELTLLRGSRLVELELRPEQGAPR